MGMLLCITVYPVHSFGNLFIHRTMFQTDATQARKFYACMMRGGEQGRLVGSQKIRREALYHSRS